MQHHHDDSSKTVKDMSRYELKNIEKRIKLLGKIQSMFYHASLLVTSSPEMCRVNEQVNASWQVLIDKKYALLEEIEGRDGSTTKQ